MKKITGALLIAVAIAAGSCSGDHSSKSGEDTAKVKYKEPSTKDTSKVTTTTGDASNVDNGGSGGTKIAKDTTGMSAKKDSTKK